MKKIKCLRPAVKDILVLTLFLSMLVSNRIHGDEVSAQLFNQIYVIMTGYFLVRIILGVNRKLLNLIIMGIQLWAIFEVIKGILQIVGIIGSGNTLFSCTGSFDNPGPYGGFLAVCIAISLPRLVFKGQNNNGVALISRIITYTSVVLCCIVLPSTQSRAALLAVAGGAASCLSVNIKARSLARRYWRLLALCVIVLFAVVLAFKQQSANGRVFINRINLKTMVDNRMRGVGMGHFAGAYGKSQMAYFKERIEFDNGTLVFDENDRERQVADTPNAPFNEFFRIGIEFGLFPLLVFMLLCGVTICNLWNSTPEFLCGFVSILCFMLFSYPLSEWQFLTLLVVCMACPAGKAGSVGSYMTWDYIPVAAGAFFLCITLTKLSGLRECNLDRAKWESQRFLYEGRNFDNYEYCCSQLYESQKCNCAFLYEYAYSLFMNGKPEESRIVAQKGLQLSCNPLLFILLGDIDKAQGRITQAEQDYENAFYILPDRLYPLSRLATLYLENHDTVRLVNMVNSIRTFKPRVESASTQRIRFETDEMVWNSGIIPQ